MLEFVERYNDLERISRHAPDFDALTLCAIGRNEMFFLPAFLEHYRRLGVEQFAILDDRSDDGTTEYLMEQDDVVIYRSSFRYGDVVEVPDLGKSAVSSGRILYIWRTILFEMFAKRRWAIQVDLDEFLKLPNGKRLQDIEQMLAASRHSLVYGLMLDVYPKSVSDLSSADACRSLDLSAPVYFDAEPHLKLRRQRYPKILHPGARARLYHSFGLSETYTSTRPEKRSSGIAFWKRRTDRTARVIPYYNTLQKPVFSKWPSGAYFLSSHKANVHATDAMLLPIVHYRFTSKLYQKIEMALREKSYSSNSLDHQLLSDLLSKMSSENSEFLYPNSLELSSYKDLEKSGNAFGV